MGRTKKQNLTVPEIRLILLRHSGSMTEIAAELGIRSSSVSFVLSGQRASERVVEAARQKAESLLRREARAGSVA